MKKNFEEVRYAHPTSTEDVLRCMVECGLTEDMEGSLCCLMDSAKALGRMPDDVKVLVHMLQSFGFVRQSSKVEGGSIKGVIEKLGDLGMPAIVLFHTKIVGRSFVYRVSNGGYTCLTETEDTKAEFRMTEQVWIRWDDSVDRSPYPRRRGNKAASRKECREYDDTNCFQYFQPNPLGNRIGDCVVRGLSGVLDIPWEEVIDLLAEEGRVVVNQHPVYSKVLERHGYIHRKQYLEDGKPLSGADFCKMLLKAHGKGARVFAHVGRQHVAAILPVVENGTVRAYKIHDSWDSSKRNIGEYWIKFATTDSAEAVGESSALTVGARLIHPNFGEGAVQAVENGLATVAFTEGEVRKLGVEWMQTHCKWLRDQAG